MATVAILMTVFNRKEKTLESLSRCFRQIDEIAADGFESTVYLNDDGSTDGLYDAVSEAFPQVKIIRSEGNQYLSLGLFTAWQRASEDQKYDFYFWLDYDIVLKDHALHDMLFTSSFLRNKAILVGSVARPDEADSGKLMYGGRARSGKLIKPDHVIPVPCYVFDGHFVLVPEYVFSIIGNLDPKYHQNLGDYDYSIRAVKAGLNRVLAPGILATCDRKIGLPAWQDGSFSLRKRYLALTSPKGRPFKETFLYDSRSRGFFYAVWHLVEINLQVIFPFRKG